MRAELSTQARQIEGAVAAQVAAAIEANAQQVGAEAFLS